MEFGAALHEVRIVKKLSLLEISKSLKIRQTYLSAIEEGRINDLPGLAYANGFVRVYAGYLGLDIPEVMCRFANAKGNVQGNGKIVPPSPEQEAYFPTGRVLFIAVCMAVLVYGGWNHLNFYGSHLDGLSNLKQNKTSSIKDFKSAKNGGSKELQGSKLLQKQIPARLENSTLKPKNFSVSGSKTSAFEVKQKVSLPKKVEETPIVKTVRNKITEGRVVVRAKTTSWIQLNLPNGKALFSGLLRAGNTYKIPRKAGIKMITGNAGGTEIFVDGQLIKRLGPNGSVRRNILMDPKALLSRNLGSR